MPTRSARGAPLSRSRAAVLAAATEALVRTPELSLSELAAAIGISRTTLHRMFATRDAIVVAIAHDAIDQLAEGYAVAGLGQDEPLVAIRRAVDQLIPLGPRLVFLLRSDAVFRNVEISRRAEDVDAPMYAAIGRAQHSGVIDAALPAWWVIECLYALVFVAWEKIRDGRLASADGADLVMRTWLTGASAPGADR